MPEISYPEAVAILKANLLKQPTIDAKQYRELCNIELRALSHPDATVDLMAIIEEVQQKADICEKKEVDSNP